jgi:hypothetical protein
MGLGAGPLNLDRVNLGRRNLRQRHSSRAREAEGDY